MFCFDAIKLNLYFIKEYNALPAVAYYDEKIKQ